MIPRPIKVSTGSLHTGECPVPSLWWLALTATLFWIKIHDLNNCPQSPVLSMPQWLGALSQQTHQSLCWWLRTTLVFLVCMFHSGKSPTKFNNLCCRKIVSAFYLSLFSSTTRTGQSKTPWSRKVCSVESTTPAYMTLNYQVETTFFAWWLDSLPLSHKPRGVSGVYSQRMGDKHWAGLGSAWFFVCVGHTMTLPSSDPRS